MAKVSLSTIVGQSFIKHKSVDLLEKKRVLFSCRIYVFFLPRCGVCVIGDTNCTLLLREMPIMGSRNSRKNTGILPVGSSLFVSLLQSRLSCSFLYHVATKQQKKQPFYIPTYESNFSIIIPLKVDY